MYKVGTNAMVLDLKFREFRVVVGIVIMVWVSIPHIVLDVKTGAGLYQQTRGGRVGLKGRDVQGRLGLLVLPMLLVGGVWVGVV